MSAWKGVVCSVDQLSTVYECMRPPCHTPPCSLPAHRFTGRHIEEEVLHGDCCAWHGCAWLWTSCIHHTIPAPHFTASHPYHTIPPVRTGSRASGSGGKVIPPRLEAEPVGDSVAMLSCRRHGSNGEVSNVRYRCQGLPPEPQGVDASQFLKAAQF
jgi:hypothetical protein